MAGNALTFHSIVIGSKGEISYLEQGTGEPALFLHGIGSGARSWRTPFEALAGDPLRLIAWDSPGYGTSTALDGPMPQPVEYAEALEAFVSAANLPTFHLIGHSLGSLIAANYVLRYPERVRSLTLASIAPGHFHLPEEERQRLRDARLKALEQFGVRGMAEKRGPELLSRKATADMHQSVIETMAALRPNGFRQAVWMLSQGDTRATLAQIGDDVPVQIIFGDADTVTTPDSNRRTASARPSAPIHVIADAGHAVYIEKPKEFAKIVRDFIQGIKPGKSST